MNYFCGIDISSKRIGITVINSLEEIKISQTYKFCENQTQLDKRLIFKKLVMQILKVYKINSVYLEEVRLFSYGGSSGKYFISEKAIFRLLSMIITLMNANIQVYKINSRSWKSRILKHGGYTTDKKGSQEYIADKYKIKVNHDQADSICISIYALRFGTSMAKLID